jgi:hypothetical protein
LGAVLTSFTGIGQRVYVAKNVALLIIAAFAAARLMVAFFFTQIFFPSVLNNT